jgi:integrase
MKARGFGRVYQPTYRDRKSQQLKKSPTWWIQCSFRGVKHRESSHSLNRMDGVRLLRRRLEEMGRGRLVGPQAEKLTFQDLARMLVDDYAVNARKSAPRAASAIKRLEQFFGFMRALDIGSDRVTAYIRTRQEFGAKPATIRYELAVLKRMFTLALRAGKLDRKPYLPSIEVRNIRTNFFAEKEFHDVLSHLPDELRPVATFAYCSGWRHQEILSLQWRQVDFPAGMVRLDPGTTKNDEGRTFPFGVLPELAAVLHAQKQRTEAVQHATDQIIPWVFHREGKPIRNFRKAWDNACEAAGVPGRWFHDFRRTAVRNLERSGVPRSVAMKLTGHKTESIYRRYAIVSESDLSEGVRKLAALSHPQEAPSGRVTDFPGARKGKARAKQEVLGG